MIATQQWTKDDFFEFCGSSVLNLPGPTLSIKIIVICSTLPSPRICCAGKGYDCLYIVVVVAVAMNIYCLSFGYLLPYPALQPNNFAIFLSPVSSFLVHLI